MLLMASSTRSITRFKGDFLETVGILALFQTDIKSVATNLQTSRSEWFAFDDESKSLRECR